MCTSQTSLPLLPSPEQQRPGQAHVVVISQPTYLPWWGYFELIARSDTFVFLDQVQFIKRSWLSRNQLKDGNGQPFWLTVPVLSHERDTPIHAIRINHEQKWRHKHLRAIETSLARTPFFEPCYSAVRQWLETDYDYLADMNIAGIEMLCGLLSLPATFLRSSRLGITGKRSELLANICHALSATSYYSARGAQAYMEGEKEHFEAINVPVRFQDWEHPAYAQKGDNFVSHLSILDALCNIGPEACREAILPRSDNQL